MTAQHEITQPEPADTPPSEERRNFLRGLGKWSLAVIGGVLLGSALTESNQANAYGSWINRYGGGGHGAWVNRRAGGGWVNRYGGGGWFNRR